MNLFRDDREYQEYKTQPPMEAIRDLAYDMGLPRINRGVVKAGKAIGRGALRVGRWVKGRAKEHGLPRVRRLISDYLDEDDGAPQKRYSSNNKTNGFEMNELKQQIVYMRQAMFSKGMTRELEGFDTAIRLFADTKKKSFKQKLSEGWQKHKGKILAGAALAAGGGAGLWGYNQKKEADKYKANNLALGVQSAVLNAQYKQLESQLKSAKAEYNAASAADNKTKKELEARISQLQKQLLQMRNAAQKAQIEANKAKKDLEAEKNKRNIAPAGTNLATGGGKGTLSDTEFDPVATRTDYTPYGTTPASSYIPL
jgi:outer membrane murein-binding lipoprotein Lpp